MGQLNRLSDRGIVFSGLLTRVEIGHIPIDQAVREGRLHLDGSRGDVGSIATEAYTAGVVSGPKSSKCGPRSGTVKRYIRSRTPSSETCRFQRSFRLLTLMGKTTAARAHTSALTADKLKTYTP